LNDEVIEIPGAGGVETAAATVLGKRPALAIPSIEKQKVFVADQMQRFHDIHDYPCILSDRLMKLREDLYGTNARGRFGLGASF